MILLLAQQATGWLNMLADGAAGGDGVMSMKDVAYLIGTVVTAMATATLGRKRGREEGRAEVSVTGLPEPVVVRLQEEFVARREFDKHQVDMGLLLGDIKARIEATMAKFDGHYERMNERINETRDVARKHTDEIATGAYKGRQKIWEEVNPLRERLAKVEERNSVQLQIGEAIAVSLRKDAQRK